MQQWTDPAVLYPALIAAGSGLLGAIIGGLCTLWATRNQLKKQDEDKKLEWRLRLGKQIHTLRLMIDKAQNHFQYTEAGLAARRFFFDNPESLLLEVDHQKFFDE